MKTENGKILKIKKASRVTAKVINAVKWIMIVAGIIMAAALIVVLVKENEINTEIVKSIEAGEGRFEFINEFKIGFIDLSDHYEARLASEDYARYIMETLIYAIVMVAVGAFVMFELEGIFKFMENNDTPFKQEILRKITYAGISLAILELLSSLALAAIVALVTWCIYNVVDYGCILQSDYDETL